MLIQIKTMIHFHYIPVRMAEIKNSDNFSWLLTPLTIYFLSNIPLYLFIWFSIISLLSPWVPLRWLAVVTRLFPWTSLDDSLLFWFQLPFIYWWLLETFLHKYIRFNVSKKIRPQASSIRLFLLIFYSSCYHHLSGYSCLKYLNLNYFFPLPNYLPPIYLVPKSSI